MINAQNVASLIGVAVVDADGEKIGTVGQIYVDPGSGQPNWATVKMGLLGRSEYFIPLERADEIGGDIRIPFSKEIVKDAPSVDASGSIGQEEQTSLYAYYRGITGLVPVEGEVSRTRDIDLHLQTDSRDTDPRTPTA
ncbi:PRC-barrel domain-containing protein [Lacisediminihabitans changchengi]|uniref:PRC-barrel domain-containing protein n=1 Tax=Lacisediminihabitans changchengi TaxID=2787634 RepID=A0A934W2S3_9MICO|nr:PRC-barrel domain-containing protein [Lacisediminihabitans changchengi]MBK4347131.1 PRC-barrel domain-containing protein [Lacisediminihabitans changchengi]